MSTEEKCVACGSLLTKKKHECNKLYCENSKQKMEIGHLCYMAKLKANCLGAIMYSMITKPLKIRRLPIRQQCMLLN